MDHASTERILVCRPQPEADRLCSRLSALGWQAKAFPTLEIVPVADDPALRQALLDLDQFEAVIVISPSAARAFVDRVNDLWPQWPTGLQWIAVGQKTAAILRAEGLTVQTPPHGSETSEGVLALPPLQATYPQRILLIAGEDGRDLIEKTLATRGHRLTRLALYQRRPLAYDPSATNAALVAFDPTLLIALSGETLRQLCVIARQIDVSLVRTPLLVPGPRVAAEARSAGFETVLMPDAMTDDAIVACIRAWTTRTTTRQESP